MKKAQISEESKKQQAQSPYIELKFDLILEIINLIINISINEKKETKVEDKKKLINLFDAVFTEMKKNMFMLIKENLANNLMKNIKANLVSFDKYIFKNTVEAFGALRDYSDSKIKVDDLLEKLIVLFEKSIVYIRPTKDHCETFAVLNNFYEYLDNNLKKITELKKVVSNKLSKKEEQEVLNTEVAEYVLKIETLQKILEEKEKENYSLNEKVINLSLDAGAYKDESLCLKKKMEEMNIKEEQKNVEMDEIKQSMKRIEEKLGMLELNQEKLEKENSQTKKKIQKLYEENVKLKLAIKQLEEMNKNLENKNIEQKKIIEKNKKTIAELLRKVKELEQRIEQDKQEKREFIEVFKKYINDVNKLKNIITQNYNDFLQLSDYTNNLASTVNQLALNYDTLSQLLGSYIQYPFDPDFFNYNFFK